MRSVTGQINGSDGQWASREEFKTAVCEWAQKIRVKPSRIQLQKMTQKWASCSANGVVSFNKALLERDRRFGEAVIVHELLHLSVRNHGRLFRSLLRAHMPQAEALLAEPGVRLPLDTIA